MLLLSAILFFLFLDSSHGYENMVRKGYNNCIACHHTPRGGGLLTEYGKLVSNSEALWGNDDYKEGSFKKAIRLGGKLDHGVHLRVANVRTETTSDTFPMQADYLTAFQGENWTIVSQLARAPSRRSSVSSIEEPALIDTLYFRELKAIVKIDSSQLLTVGRERQNLGLRFVDHTYFNKSFNRFNVTDLATVFSYDRLSENQSFMAALFIPNFQEVESEKEFGGKVEYRRNFGKLQVGLGALYGETESIDRILGTFFGKMGFFDNFYLFNENILTRRKTNDGISFNQRSHLIGLSYFPITSLELFVIGETISRDDPFELDVDGLGFGARQRLLANLTARFDFKRNFFENRKENVLISQLFFNGW